MSEIKELPHGWEWWKLDGVANVMDYLRKPINSTERQSRVQGKSRSELFPYYGATGQVGWIDHYITDGEYVLVGEDGAPFLDPYKDKAYRIRGKTWVNNHAHILQGKEGIMLNAYLLYYLNAIDYREHVNGTTRLKLTKGCLVDILVARPSLEEQQQIVSKIEELFSELDKGVEQLEQAQARLKVYRQAVLKTAFEGVTQKENKTVEECCDNIVDCLHSTAKFKESGYCCVDTTCIENGKILFDKIRYVDETTFKERISRLKPIEGDILFAREGTVGTTLIIPHGIELCLGQRMMMFRTKKEISSKYFMYFFQSPLFKSQYQPLIMGTTAQHLNIKDIRKFKIVTCPPDEQQQIVSEIERRLSVCDQLETTIAHSLQQAATLRQSILKRAFEGRLV